ncbi:M50 family metallopeptidase [Paenibacillus agricola]|uniref:Zn-dependent protease n=1 Tax=Paenibacillus agricola TaxID=2716264 RepID=A0ABX0J1H8_9BACL|nr:M50 family metallopeptidase [Paenibacillus agricola]NHN30089.1 Zn-dependent protease [Paenibacillus agricola]
MIKWNRWNRWFGITFRFHPLFSVVMLLSVVGGYFIEMATLFGIVLVHEMGHAIAAKGFGWRVKEVLLLPFGGEAVVEELGNVPVWQEIVVIISGPLQNVWMILIAHMLQWMGLISEQWAAYFIQANLFIALFNLLPISPLDGGKLLQAVMGLWLPYYRVISINLTLGLMLSLILTLGSLLHVLRGGIQMNLFIIGVFLIGSNWYAYKGRSYHFMRFLLHRETAVARLIGRGTLACPIVVSGERRVTDVVRLFMREKVHLIYILDPHGSISVVVPERPLLQSYFNESKRGCAISELFM